MAHGWLERFFPTEAGTSAAIINRLLRGRPEPRSYLEIGIAAGETLRSVNAHHVVGVDPYPGEFQVPENCTIHRMTSRDYFASLTNDVRFDVIFVDGLHLWQDCLEDTLSAFDHLANEGFVIIDDVYPAGPDEAVRASSYEEAVRIAATAGRDITSWMGDVWRVLFVLAHVRDTGLQWATLPIAHGRYHTILWRTGTTLSRLRDLIGTDVIKAGEIADLSAVGDFTREGMASMYRYRPYWRFLASQRGREMRSH
jgi:hypothetical protein